MLDSNILLVSIPISSKYRIIFDQFLENKFTLVISNEILLEYAEIISQKTNSIVSTNIIEMLLSAKNVKMQEIFYRWQLIVNDEDDNKFIDCTIAANADFLVTNDKHFNSLKSLSFPPIKILSIDEFVEVLSTPSRH
ncbi:MAG: putative toxin-antitoxin system toxin component, PIN family [Candidatus Kapabacteria bacterium]|nr:putative toxin-antitoxin system toxin component, PIN family [Candidatus Kapabacteria bacterium]